MPKHPSRRISRTSAGQISQRVLARPRSSNATDHPLASVDPDLIGSIVEMREQNEERLRKALIQIATRAPTEQQSHHAGHPFSAPILSFGTDHPERAGSWYQRVCSRYCIYIRQPYSFYKCKPMRGNCHAHYISAPLDPELLFGNSQLGDYMRIRQELAPPSKRKPIPKLASHSAAPKQRDPGHTVTSMAQAPRSPMLSTRTQLHPAQPQAVPGPSSAASVQSEIPVPNAGLLDTAFPVTVMAWLEVSSSVCGHVLLIRSLSRTGKPLFKSRPMHAELGVFTCQISRFLLGKLALKRDLALRRTGHNLGGFQFDGTLHIPSRRPAKWY
jgi:hypothetical protein